MSQISMSQIENSSSVYGDRSRLPVKSGSRAQILASQTNIHATHEELTTAKKKLSIVPGY